MNPPIVSATGHPLFQFKTVEPRNARSLRSIARNRVLGWLEKASVRAIVSTLGSLLTVLCLALLIFAWQFTLGLLASAFAWNGYKIPLFLGALAVTFYAKPAWRRLKRSRIKARGGNQHTYHGIPVPEFASWLLEQGAFKIEDATRKWAFSKDKYYAIANELDKNGLLVRGEKNARVLRPVSYADLVYQLRDGRFPLVWDEIGAAWVEKDDPYGRHLREKSFRARKLGEQTERTERRAERAENRLEKAKDEYNRITPSVADVLSLAG